jgi:tetratricopeptide (TPR) repeat protein
MPCPKYPLYFMILVAVTSNACRNKNGHPEDKVPEIVKSASFKNLNDSIQMFPQDASLYLRRALRLTQENAHEPALADFQKAWTLQPSLENAMPYAANLEILGKHPERLSLLESLSQRYPENEQVSRLLADAYTSMEKPEKAMMIYKGMIAKDSLNPEILYEQALILEQIRDTSQAIAALRKAYSVQGVDTYGLELAHLYAEQKNPRCLEICNFILRRDSAGILIDPFFIKGIYYANIKQYKKAIAEFDSCISRDWKTTDAYLEKGRAYFQMGNYNAASQTFKMAITVTNTDPDAYFWLGRSYEALQRRSEAVSNYLKAISLDRNFTEARQRLDKLDSGFAHHGH